MDFSHNGYEFLFEIQKIRLIYGKYRYVAKITRVLDTQNRTVVSEVGLQGEVYGRAQQDARKAAVDWAKEWAEAQR